MQPVDDKTMCMVVSMMVVACGPVRVVGSKIVMSMRQFLLVDRRPKKDGCKQADPCQRPERQGRRRQSQHRTKPTGQRVGKKPSRMRQGEVRGEKRGTIFGVGGTPQQSSRRRLRN